MTSGGVATLSFVMELRCASCRIGEDFMRQLIGLLLLMLRFSRCLPRTKCRRIVKKTFDFAVAQNGQIVSRVPTFSADKWILKNQKKYPGLVFFTGAQLTTGELSVGILDLAVGLQRNLSNRKNQHQHEHDARVREWNCHRQLWRHVETTYDGTGNDLLQLRPRPPATRTCHTQTPQTPYIWGVTTSTEG